MKSVKDTNATWGVKIFFLLVKVNTAKASAVTLKAIFHGILIIKILDYLFIYNKCED